MEKQPKSKPGVEAVQEMVIADLRERTATGVVTYGRPLETHNGRSPVQDAYEESLDQTQYLRQALEEERDVRAVLVAARALLREVGEQLVTDIEVDLLMDAMDAVIPEGAAEAPERVMQLAHATRARRAPECKGHYNSCGGTGLIDVSDPGGLTIPTFCWCSAGQTKLAQARAARGRR